MRRFTLLFLTLLLLAFTLSACGGGNKGAAVVPTYHSKNFIERQIFNHRLQISDDPSTVLFCTSFPLDSKPFTNAIAGKLVSGTKRPDPTYNYDSNNNSYENPDAQGMFGSSVPYRFGFSPGNVYSDWTDIPTYCSTQAWAYQDTSGGFFTVNNDPLTKAATAAQTVLKAGSLYRPSGAFYGYRPGSQQAAQKILNDAIAAQAKGQPVGSIAK